MNIKCMSCGLINWSSATVCRRCEAPIQALGNAAPPAPLQIQRSVQQPAAASPVQRPGFQTPPAYQNQAPYQNPDQAGFPYRQPLANLAGQQKPLPIHRPGQEVPLPISPPQQPDHSPYAANPSQQFPAPEAGSPASNYQPFQNQANPNSQPYKNLPNPNQQPFANHQPYQNYPISNYPSPQLQTRPPYGNNPQPRPYPIGSPYAGNPTLQNPQPYQTGFAPPQSFPGQYAPGQFVPPPPFASPKSSLNPVAKVFLTLIVLGAVVGFVILRTLLNRERTESLGEEALAVKYLKVPNRDSSSIAGMRENFLSYLGKDRDVRFGFDEMQKQLFYGINEIVYDEKKGEVLFLVWDCSERDPTKMQRIIDRYAIDPTRVFYGESFKQKAGAFQGKTKLAWVNHCPLVIPVDNIRINPYSSVEIKYATATYNVSAQELADYMTDKSVYSGPMRIFSKDRVQRELNVFGNHGAFVAKPNEPSLTRLAGSLTVSGDSLSREGRIQSLLDFVSSEITYDDSEAKFKGEILKRPDETLMTRRGDCSSKTILMASLLEQIGEDYRLVYYIDHITVAVRQGGFKNFNNLGFSREGETWAIAETTVPGFIIGETSIENRSIFKDIQYIQRPGKSNEVSAFNDLKEIFFE